MEKSVNLESNLWSPGFFQEKRRKKIDFTTMIHQVMASGQIISVRFLGESKRPYIAFEIY